MEETIETVLGVSKLENMRTGTWAGGLEKIEGLERTVRKGAGV